MKIMIVAPLVFLGLNAFAVCPKDAKQFQEQAPKFLIELASRVSKGEISNFSSKIEKDASAGTASVQAGSETWYFVRADYKSESVSGLVKCDSQKDKLIALSLGWHAGNKKSGVSGGPLE